MDAATFHRAVAQRAPQIAGLDLLLDRLQLDDGRAVVLRPLLREDAPAEQAFVRGLSPLSRQRRFHLGIRELAPGLLHRLTDVDQRRHVALAALHQDEGDDPPGIVADARYVVLDDCAEAEFALAVDDDWQGLGLGRALLARLLAHARAQGLRALVGEVLHDNAPMLGLVRRCGGRLLPHPGDASLVRAWFVC